MTKKEGKLKHTFLYENTNSVKYENIKSTNKNTEKRLNVENCGNEKKKKKCSALTEQNTRK